MAHELNNLAAGPPVLLLHAGVTDSRMQDAHVPHFAPHYTVIRCDLPGFGQSAPLPGRVAPHEQLVHLLHHLQVPQAAVVGTSYGGRLALDLALCHPALVAALVLVAPGVGGQPPSDVLERFAAEEEAALARGDLDAATELNLRMWVDGPYRRPEEVDPAVRAQMRMMQYHAFTISVPADVEVQPLEPLAIGRLGVIRAPTLILIGELDVAAFRTLAERLAGEIPQAELVQVPRVAHMVTMEQPELFNAVVLAFLRKHGPMRAEEA